LSSGDGSHLATFTPSVALFTVFLVS